MVDDSERQQTECTPCKCFRCGSLDNIITKFSKPPKDNEKSQNTFRFNERGNCATQKEPWSNDNDNDQKIYESMSQMSGNDKSFSGYFGDSLQLTN